MKKIISIIITISMLLASVPVFAISGTGTETNPYLISSVSDIAKIHDDLNGYYKLTNNINMSGVTFEPIGNENEGAFTGTIDGAGYTISNLNINLPENKYVGFVGYLEGTVKNLNLTNVDASGYRYVGGLVGYAENSSEIVNCSANGNIYGDYVIIDVYTGGISGYSAGVITKCTNNGKVYSETTYAGGISGYSAGNISDCINTGVINLEWGNINTKKYCGGICGYSTFSVLNCYNSGNVSTSSANVYIGGIVGLGSQVKSCVNYEAISCFADDVYSYTGGITGQSSFVSMCVNYGDVAGGGGYHSATYSTVRYAYAGGIAGYNTRIEKSINYGNITKIDYDAYAGGIGASSCEITCCMDMENSGLCIGDIYCRIYDSVDYWSVYPPHSGSNRLSAISNVFLIEKNSSSGRVYKSLDSYDSLNLDQMKNNYAWQGFDFNNIWTKDSNMNSGLVQLRGLPQHMILDEMMLYIGKNESKSITAYIGNNSKEVKWSSSNDGIATVSSDGMVSGIGYGNCVITGESNDGMKTYCFVSVYDKAMSIEFESPNYNVNIDSSFIPGIIQGPNQMKEEVYWESDNPTVATVDRYSGKVTGISKGKTTITVSTIKGDIKANCMVEVSAYINKMTLSAINKTLKKGESCILPVITYPVEYDGDISWNSSDDNIATVNNDGEITALQIGEAVITATATSGVTAQCKVTVNQPATSITLNKDAITTYVGSIYQLSAATIPVDTTDSITWSSSNSDYATVSDKGLIIGISEGTATITATTSSGLTATCYITVKATPVEPTSITLSDTYITLAPEDAKALTATLLPSNTTETTLIWTSSNEDVATVDRNGVITAISEGFATIKAKTSNGLSHECVVKVVSASGPSVIVDNVKSFPAGIANTKVNIIRNPGISGYKFTISYDDALLTPVSVTANEEFGGTLTTNLDDANRTEFNVVWYSNSDTDIDINGELFTIDFKVAETAELGDYSDITIEYGAKDICNTAGENIALYTESAKVTVEEPLAGDIYEDGDVNIYDLTLLARHMIGLADFTDRQLEAANVTDDDLVDIKDVVKLAQYVVGWTDIELMSLMSLSAEMPETPTVTVGTASVNDANEADIPVYIKNNSGIAAYRFVLDYNKDDIEIVSITPSDFINPENFGTNLGQENDEGLIVFCYQEGNAVADDEFFTIKVRYKNPTDTSISPISIKFAENNFCNQAIENVAVNYEVGYALGDNYIITNKVVGDTNFSCELYFDDSYAEQSAKVIIAFYDGDARMVQLMPKDIAVKPGKVDLSIDYDKKPYATYKLMIWECMGNLKPITEVK